MNEATTQPCPRCGATEGIRHKLLLISEKSSESDPRCEEVFVDGLREDSVSDGSLRQFIMAPFCGRCELAFVPDEMLRMPRQKWVASKDGWRAVNADGTLGPPQQNAVSESKA